MVKKRVKDIRKSNVSKVFGQEALRASKTALPRPIESELIRTLNLPTGEGPSSIDEPIDVLRCAGLKPMP
ncbi:MAG: hypothetical protein ABIN18_20390 [Pseudomonadota bacterium]